MASETVRNASIAAVVVAGAALVYWRWPDHQDSAPPPPLPSQAAVGSEPTMKPPQAVKQTTPATPSLPDIAPAIPKLPNGSAATTPAEVFAVETRDPAWASAIEAEIQDRMVKAPAKLATVCHTTRCQLTLDGDTDAVGKAIAMFESEKGLVGFAENIYLTTPEVHDDGTVIVKAIATFTR